MSVSDEVRREAERTGELVSKKLMQIMDLPGNSSHRLHFICEAQQLELLGDRTELISALHELKGLPEHYLQAKEGLERSLLEAGDTVATEARRCAPLLCDVTRSDGPVATVMG